jgi:peptidoglycan hydrolase-like protein with peptidoglycan-binding domain
MAKRRSSVVPLRRQVKRGTKGSDSYAVKRALRRKGFGKSLGLKGPTRFKFGPAAVKNLKAFQRRYRLTPDGVYGRATHRKLVSSGGFDRYGRYLMSAAPKTQAATGVRERIVAAALFGARHRNRIAYTQSGLRMYGVRNKIRIPRITPYEDCSSFATWCYWHAGAKDPNGLGYSGWGYTGTQARNGKRVNSPKPGDLIFYGSGPPYSHVTVYIGNGKCVSHGSQAGPMILNYKYRRVTAIRSYV